MSQTALVDGTVRNLPVAIAAAIQSSPATASAVASTATTSATAAHIAAALAVIAFAIFATRTTRRHFHTDAAVTYASSGKMMAFNHPVGFANCVESPSVEVSNCVFGISAIFVLYERKTGRIASHPNVAQWAEFTERTFDFTLGGRGAQITHVHFARQIPFPVA